MIVDAYESQLRYRHEAETEAAEVAALAAIAAAVRVELLAARHGERWARTFSREKTYSAESREWWRNFALEYRGIAKACLRILRAGRPR